MGTGVKQILAEAGRPVRLALPLLPGRQSGAGGGDRAPLRASSTGCCWASSPGPRSSWRRGSATSSPAPPQTLRETDYADACPIATVALEISSTNEALRRPAPTSSTPGSRAAPSASRIAGIPRPQARTLVIQMLAGLEGAFVLSRALRTTEPVELAGEAAVAAIEAAMEAETPPGGVTGAPGGGGGGGGGWAGVAGRGRSARSKRRVKELLAPDRLLVQREADPRADRGDDPEAEHDLGLRPGHHLEVVVQRRHQQDAAAEGLEGEDLDRDRERLDHEDAADDDQQHLGLGHHRQGADRPA